MCLRLCICNLYSRFVKLFLMSINFTRSDKSLCYKLLIPEVAYSLQDIRVLVGKLYDSSVV